MGKNLYVVGITKRGVTSHRRTMEPVYVLASSKNEARQMGANLDKNMNYLDVSARIVAKNVATEFGPGSIINLNALMNGPVFEKTKGINELYKTHKLVK